MGAAAAVLVVAAPTGRGGFTAHMVDHLLLAMVAPLLAVLSRPVSLTLRALPVGPARRLVRLLRTVPVRVLTEPVVAVGLATGSLWLLYLTPWYTFLHDDGMVAWWTHLHLFLGGYLVVLALVGREPLPHRRSWTHRVVVATAALAAHEILAKALVARPPAGVTAADALAGAQIMSYGGDLVHLVVLVLLGLEWSRRRNHRRSAPDMLRPATSG